MTASGPPRNGRLLATSGRRAKTAQRSIKKIKLPRESVITRGILPNNIGWSDSGTIVVKLSSRWPQMLAGLSVLGPLLISTCGPQVSLGKIAHYPQLEEHQNSATSIDAAGEWDLKLDTWSHAVAKDVETERGHCYSIEFQAAQGIPVHRLVLTSKASLSRTFKLQWPA